jgi:DNA invertase Pin-like site-specific DNA recombinase
MNHNMTGTKLGYLRVSTGSQDLQLQHDALDAAGVLKRNRYIDHGVSGSTTTRPGLDALLADAMPGDTVVTYALDRLGRNAAHVLTLLEELSERDINVVSIRDGLDSSTTQGQILMKLLSVVAELERSFIRERTVAGLAAAKAQGRVGGRPRTLDSKRSKQAQVLRSAGNSPQDIAKLLGCSVSTVYRITRTPVVFNVTTPT